MNRSIVWMDSIDWLDLVYSASCMNLITIGAFDKQKGLIIFGQVFCSSTWPSFSFRYMVILVLVGLDVQKPTSKLIGTRNFNNKKTVSLV